MVKLMLIFIFSADRVYVSVILLIPNPIRLCCICQSGQNDAINVFGLARGASVHMKAARTMSGLCYPQSLLSAFLHIILGSGYGYYIAMEASGEKIFKTYIGDSTSNSYLGDNKFYVGNSNSYIGDNVLHRR